MGKNFNCQVVTITFIIVMIIMIPNMINHDSVIMHWCDAFP